MEGSKRVLLLGLTLCLVVFCVNTYEAGKPNVELKEELTRLQTAQNQLNLELQDPLSPEFVTIYQEWRALEQQINRIKSMLVSQ